MDNNKVKKLYDFCKANDINLDILRFRQMVSDHIFEMAKMQKDDFEKYIKREMALEIAKKLIEDNFITFDIGKSEQFDAMSFEGKILVIKDI